MRQSVPLWAGACLEAAHFAGTFAASRRRMGGGSQVRGRRAAIERSPVLALGLALLAAFVLVRVLSIDADPPLRLPHGLRSRELWAKWGAKAHEARNWALFGRWQVNPADNYGFWRPQAPIWVYSLAGFLKLFGVSMVAVRAHSIVVASVGFVLTLLYAAKRLGPVALFVFGCFLAGNCYYIFYTRAGLIEPMVNLFAAATVMTAYLALSEPRWLIAATVCLILASLSKASGFYLLPVLTCCALVATLRARQRGLPRVRWLLPVLISALAVLCIAAYMTNEVYQQRADWAFRHMIKAGNKASHSTLAPSVIWERLIDGRRWTRHFFPLFPVAASCSIATLVNTAWTFGRTRQFSWDVLTALWFLMAFASLQVTHRTDLRYYVVLFPPVALLGARGVELLVAAVRRWRFAPALVLLTVLGVFFHHHGSHYLHWWQHRTYNVRNTSRAVQRVVGNGNRAVIIGMWAPWLTFDTKYENYFVKGWFNVSKKALANLGVTHVLSIAKDIPGGKVRQHFPDAYRQKKKLKSFRVYGQQVTLYELRHPLGNEASVKR
jgi:hypothetical protein